MVDVPKFSPDVISDPVLAANYFARFKAAMEALQQGDDGYGFWILNTGGSFAKNISSNETLNIIGGDNITVTFSGDDLTIDSTSQVLTASNGIKLVGDDIQHEDTSAQIDIIATTDQVLSTVTFDTYGHVKTLTTRGLTPADIAAQPVDAGLTSISALVTAADTMIYTTALDVYTTTALTAFARTLLDDADAGTMRTTLGLGTIATFDGNQNLGTGDSPTFAGLTVSSTGNPIITLATSSTAADPLFRYTHSHATALEWTSGVDVSLDEWALSTGLTVGANKTIRVQAATGRFISTGDILGQSNITATGTINSNDTTDSTAPTNGSIQTDGGLGVVKSAFIGGDVKTSGEFYVEAGASGTPALFLHADAGNGNVPRIFYTGNQNFRIRDETAGVDRFFINASGTITHGGNTIHTGNLRVNDTTDSSSLITGSIQTDGGLGVTKKLFLGDHLVMNKASTGGIKVDTTTPTFGFADLLGDQFSRNTGGTKPTLTSYNGDVRAWQFGAGDEAYLSFHIPHDYVLGTEIFIHIHWSHNSTTVTGGTLTFKATSIYSKGHAQAAFQSTPAVGTFTGTASTTQYMHIISETSYSDSTPTGIQLDTDLLEPDGVIEMTFEMDANNITSSAAVPDPFIHYVDIHYQTTGLIGTKDKVPDFYT